MGIDPQSVFVLPDLGEGLQDAEIVAWHVAEGDHVVADQPLVSVETDKAVVEIPSPRSGRIARLLAAPQTRLAIGAPLVAFSADGERDTGTVVGELPTTASVQPAARPRATPAVRVLAAGRGIDLAAIAGSGPEGEITRADVESASAVRTGVEASQRHSPGDGTSHAGSGSRRRACHVDRRSRCRSLAGGNEGHSASGHSTDRRLPCGACAQRGL